MKVELAEKRLGAEVVAWMKLIERAAFPTWTHLRGNI